MKKVLTFLGYALVAIGVVVSAGALYIQYAFPNVDAAPALQINKTPALQARGEYLANHVTVCIDCHSTRDFSKFAGPVTPGTEGKGGDRFDHSMGFPGVFYARNITSDRETGIGAWTDGEVYRAITEGVSKDGEPLFPVMPFKSYSQMREQDLHAIITYIRSLAPIKNDIPKPDPDFPMNLILRTMPTKRVASAEPVLDDPVSKGKYLLTIAACSECHTPANKGKPIEGMYLAGGSEFKMPNGAVQRSANLTSDKETGIGSWTEEEFVNRFKQHDSPANTGQTVGPDDFNPIMPWAMYAGMTEEDLKAIYQFLRTVEPKNNRVVKFSPAPGKS